MATMAIVNFLAACIGIFLGTLFGAVLGLFFQREEWLGGYASWPRRMLRLAHISFFGLALLNLAFWLGVNALGLGRIFWPSRLLILAAVTMPLVCCLAAWRKPLRHLFPIPALSAITGSGIFLWRLLAA